MRHIFESSTDLSNKQLSDYNWAQISNINTLIHVSGTTIGYNRDLY